MQAYLSASRKHDSLSRDRLAPERSGAPDKSEPLHQHIWDERRHWYVSLPRPSPAQGGLAAFAGILFVLPSLDKLTGFLFLGLSPQSSSAGVIVLSPLALCQVSGASDRPGVRCCSLPSHTAGGACAHLDRATGLLTLQTLHNVKRNKWS